MSVPDIVLFDLDGTLIDSVPDLATALNRMMADLGRDPVEEEAIRNWVGNGSRILVHRTLSGSLDGRVEDDLAASAYSRFQDHYADCCLDRTRIFDQAEQLIACLRDHGIRTGIVTNKPERHAVRLMDAWSDRLPMDVVLGEIEGRPRKPDPAMLQEAMRQCDATTAWMVGDSDVDGHAARAAGAVFIGVRLGYNHGRDIAAMDPPPDQVFDDLGGLLDWIRPMIAASA